MSVITIDQFTGTHLGTNEEVTIYFNNATGVITYQSESERTSYEDYNPDRSNGDPLGSFLSADGTTSYTLTKSVAAPFASVSSTTPVEPQPPQCDLNLNVSVVNESGIDLNDGKVTMVASSSFEPVTFSVNGVAGPAVINTLAPGNYVASAIDANGCTAQVSFSIQAYDNPFGNYGCLPEVEVSEGNISRWNAAFNPIVMCFENTPDPLKVNFRIQIEITSSAGIVVGEWSPDLTGRTVCGVSSYLKSLVNANDDFKYDVLNYVDLNRSASFSFRYREVWDGGSSVWYDSPGDYFVTYSAKQLGDLYGGNMAEHVTFLNEPDPAAKAKSLTLFDEPTAWDGLPFDLSYIVSEYIDVPVKVLTTSLDINKKPTGVAKQSLLLADDVDTVLIADVDSLVIGPGELPPASYTSLSTSIGINRMMLAGSPAPTAKYFQVQLYTGTDAAPNFITQPINIEMVKPCSDPYIYLKWLNTLGGWDYWRFGHDHVLQLNTSDAISVDRVVFDWENDDTIAETIKKNAVTKISIGVTVPNSKVNGLKGLHTSVKIQMLTSLNPYKWQTVRINTGSFDIKRAKSTYTDLKFTISLPEINIQSQ